MQNYGTSPMDSESDSDDNLDKKVSALYQKKTTIAQEDLRQEYSVAYDVLKKSGQLPITIDPSCLSCMAPGRDTALTLKLFRAACLSYQPSNVAYREHTISRTSLIGMRRDLIDKVNNIVSSCSLFSMSSAFPRRYFDDLVLET